MRNAAFRKPQRKAPSLLVVPELDRLKTIFRKESGSDGLIELIAIEMERNETLAYGTVYELVAFVRRYDGKKLTLRHIVGTMEPSAMALMAAAAILGVTARGALG